MELLVCIKKVPDDSVTVTLNENGIPQTEHIEATVNAFDTYALEMATRLKEAVGGSVTVLTLDDDSAIPALRNCLSVGADRACLLESVQTDSLGKAALLAKASNNLSETPLDIIFCGSESTDLGHGQVGAQLAEILNIPVITNVLSIEPYDNSICVKQETDEGYRILETICPCVLTIVKPNYEPRYPSIKSKLAARKIPIQTISVAELAADGSTILFRSNTAVPTSYAMPPQRQAGLKIQESDPAAAVSRTMELLAEQKLI